MLSAVEFHFLLLMLLAQTFISLQTYLLPFRVNEIKQCKVAAKQLHIHIIELLIIEGTLYATIFNQSSRALLTHGVAAFKHQGDSFLTVVLVHADLTT